MNTSFILPSALLAAGLLWAALAVYTLVNRILFDWLGLRLAKALKDQAGAAPPTPGADDGIARALRYATSGTLARLVVDSTQPERLRHAVAAMIHARQGGAALAREARRGRWFSRRWRRMVAWHVLYRTGHAELHPMLGKALSDGAPDLRAAAVAMLGALGDRAAAVILVQALRRGACAPACIAMQLDRFEASIKDDILSPALNDPQPLMRLWAIRLLSRDPSIDALAARLGGHANDPDAGVRKAVAQAMGEVGGVRAAAVAVALLADEVGFVRANAVRALHKMSGTHGEVALGLLLRPIMSDPDWWVRLAVREALAGAGGALFPFEPRTPVALTGQAQPGAANFAHLPG